MSSKKKSRISHVVQSSINKFSDQYYASKITLV